MKTKGGRIMFVEKFIALGKNGEVKEVYNVKDKPVNYIIEKTKAPLIEMASDHVLDRRLFNIGAPLTDTDEQKYLDGLATSLFENWGEFGHYGDMIQFTRHVMGMSNSLCSIYTVDHIGRLAFPKGVLATDLVPVFVDSHGNEFFVGITIGKGKNKGKPALIGGHLDLNGYHFETPAEALIHEAKDEAGICFSPTPEIREKMEQVPFLEKVPVRVDFNGKTYPAELKLIGTYRTSSEEKIERLGCKRVDWTTAYYLVVNVDFPLDKKKISELLKAGDDAEELLITKLGADKTPEFAYSHHREIFLDAIRKF